MDSQRKFVQEDISIAIVEDHEVVLEGYRSFFIKNGISHIEVFRRARMLLNRVSAHPFDLYIVDLGLPDMDTYSLTGEIRKLQPGARFVINTLHEEQWSVRRLSQKNVDGVVCKSGSLHQLIEAVETVIYGKRYYCGDINKTTSKLTEHDDVPSDREQEILSLIAQGYSTKEIGQRLFISENTVENHRKSLFKKLHARNMADLTIKAIVSGYIDIGKLEH